jgi:hypothetical protein
VGTSVNLQLTTVCNEGGPVGTAPRTPANDLAKRIDASDRPWANWLTLRMVTLATVVFIATSIASGVTRAENASALASQEQKTGRSWNAAIFQNILPKQKNVFAVAVSTHASRVNLTEVNCLSLDPNWAHVDRADHSDDADMRKAVREHLENRSLSSPDCGFFIHWTIDHGKTSAVRYRGDPSVALMSFSICKKPLDGPAGRQCLSKNIWLFDKIRPVADEYALGIKAFVSSSNAAWSVVNVSRNSQ